MDKGLVFYTFLFKRMDAKNILRLIYADSTVKEPWKFSILFNLIHKFSIFWPKKTCILIVFCNLPIEQLWPEVNNRVNYPSKRPLNEMENSQIIDMKDDVVKYCISPVSCMVSSYGLLNELAPETCMQMRVSKLV